MAGESNADVYASFGVNSAVVGGSTPTDHEQAMLELDVAARDGDDSIELAHSDDPYGSNDPFGEEDEDRTEIRISTEGEPEVTEEGEIDYEEGSEEFEPVGDVPDELNEASSQLEEHEAGFEEMVTQAAERGLSEETIVRIQQEYGEDGLSEESYEELAKAGYSKSFVDSYIRGQEALVEQYVQSVMEYAGGEAQFQAIYNHLEVSNPDAAESLISALENRDLATVKAIVNLAGASRAKTFGKPAARSISKRAVPAAPVRTKQSGFESQAEMIAAMSDPLYRHDSKFRAEVERKMMYSQF
ncbi:capsid and scaffold protein [Shigella phage VB_Ship_A7]|uniref:Capsid and scaffold protein n=1 Tax=Shigella phage VB_Ship_A7 TaxID=2562138 RepID=A0A4D6DRP2_9CAUD|nr:head assembly [Shigella phage VB_Ship_A7]QBZ68991.1 capsid and scaffold protein [Shigella phage VB_Ship_A7]